MMSAEKFLTFGMMLTLFVVIGCSQNSDAPSKSTTGNSSGATESVPAASKPSSVDNETAGGDLRSVKKPRIHVDGTDRIQPQDRLDG